MKKVILLILSVMLMSCNQVNFGLKAQPELAKESLPFNDGDQLEPIIDREAIYKSGPCEDGEEVSACLKCHKPVIDTPPVPPPALTKAQKLAEIIAASCSVKNKSDPENYHQVPSLGHIRSRLLACTNDVYPETPVTNAQEKTLRALLGDDPNLREKFYQGLWYKPPYTDHFELYFGISSFEARRLLCYDNWQIQGDLLTSEYAEYCMRTREYPFCPSWKGNARMQANWQAAQRIRAQLKSCVDQNYKSPTPVEPDPVIGITCEYSSFEGSFASEGRSFAYSLLAQGYKVSVEDGLTCRSFEADSVAPAQDWVRVVGTRCL